MARTLVPVYSSARAGTVVVPLAVDQPNGMYVPAISANMRVEVKNTAGSPMTVTQKKLQCPTCADTADRTVTVAAGATADVGQLNPVLFAQGDGSLWLDFSVGAAGTIYALQ